MASRQVLRLVSSSSHEQGGNALTKSQQRASVLAAGLGGAAILLPMRTAHAEAPPKEAV
jgi:hypothetical protein